MDINKSILDLLLRNDCLVVPGFGGFVCSYQAAQIDFSKGLLTPPRKKILFNKQLVNNDGLLIHYLVSSYKLSYSEVEEKLSFYVNTSLEKLHSGQRIEIEKIGSIFLDHEKNIQFDQDRFFNLLLSSFGLNNCTFIPEAFEEKNQEAALSFDKILLDKQNVEEAIAVTPLVERKETKIVTIVPENQKEEAKIVLHPISKKSSKRLLKYIAAACLLPIAFYTIWIPVRTDVLDSGVLFSSDFNPFQNVIKAVYEAKDLQANFEKIENEISFEEQIANLPEEVSIYSYEFAEDVYIPIKLDRALTSEIKAKEVTSNTSNVLEETKFSTSSFNIKVIVGSFSNELNAKNLVSSLKNDGFTSFLIQENEIYRVCAGQTNSNKDAEKIVKKLADLEIESWILK